MGLSAPSPEPSTCYREKCPTRRDNAGGEQEWARGRDRWPGCLGPRRRAGAPGGGWPVARARRFHVGGQQGCGAWVHAQAQAQAQAPTDTRRLASGPLLLLT